MLSTDSIIEPDAGLLFELPCWDSRNGEHQYQVKLIREFDSNYSLSENKIRELWIRAKEHKALFSDYTDGKFEPFFWLLTDPRAVWFEIVRSDDQSNVGVIYLTAVKPLFEADCHMAMWDSIAVGKEPLALFAMEWIMDRYKLHRLNAFVPTYQRGVLRWCDRLGFVQEGVRREAVLFRGQWADLVQFGILRPEVENQIRRIW